MLGGYLIAASLERSRGAVDFLKKRMVRLYPEFWVMVFVNLFVIWLVGYEYNIFSVDFVKWIVHELMGICTTPSFFKGYAVGSFSGALWTIMVEVQLYIVALLIYPLAKKMNPKKWGATLTLFFIAEVCRILLPGARIISLLDRTFVTHATSFLMGMTVFLYKDIVLKHMTKWEPSIIAIYVLFCVLCPSSEVRKIVALVVVPVCIIGLAYRLGKIRFKLDISYSIYLYHMVVLNVWIFYGIKAGIIEFLLLALCVGCVSVISGYAFSKVSKVLKRKLC